MGGLILGVIVSAMISCVSSKTSAQLCNGTATNTDGNSYCSEVTRITYHNISQSGSYLGTINMNVSSGICSHENISYPGTGSLTPLLGEISIHLRGPMNLSQLAAYALSQSSTGKERRFAERHRGYQHVHKRRRRLEALRAIGTEAEKLEMDNLFIDTTDRQALSWNDVYDGTSTALEVTKAVATPQTVTNTDDRTLTAATNIRDAAATASPTGASWERIAYYRSVAPAQATGLTFLNSKGDEAVSGTFDTTFGNSLSYSSSDGTTCANQSTPFNGNLSTSEIELIVMTDQVCSGDCDYYRPKSVAYHGWNGESKAFFIEFQMDHYNNTGNDLGAISDAPAWWFLNANIPRILQYGNDRNNKPCACWSYGCGEFDAFEVLEMGEVRAKSTIHRQGNIQGGDSNYFLRPVGKTAKVAVVFYEYNITVSILDDSFDFSDTLTASQIADIVTYDPNSNTDSLFTIGS